MTAWLLVLLAATPLDGGSTAPTVTGSLDKEIIRSVIRRNTRAIAYCYERTLVKKPDANGKIAVTFTISKEGNVSSAEAKEDTIGDGVMQQCVVSRVKMMTFPAPKGGGIVIVTYPFMFAPSK
jgi:outer membrane biosynthesis protein TonB